MTLEELRIRVPELNEYLKHMPQELNNRYWIRYYPEGTIIHQKDELLDYFGIVCEGSHRVINEFENGNIYMIERNDPVDFVGEVTILAGKARTSVTIETLTACTVLYFSRKDFENWISQDIHFLRLVSGKVAYKLYRSSYNRGSKLFYPPQYLLLDYLIKYLDEEKKGFGTIPKTRQQLYEETGISVKTINRTIQKLKSDNLVSTVKGKLHLDYNQKLLAKQYLEENRHISK